MLRDSVSFVILWLHFFNKRKWPTLSAPHKYEQKSNVLVVSAFQNMCLYMCGRFSRTQAYLFHKNLERNLLL